MSLTGTTAEPRIIASDLAHRFEGRPYLFSGLGFDLRPCEVYALMGPSGSGKSTLLSILAGWCAPTGGALARENIRTIAWVFQNPHGVPGRTAEDIVALPLLARGSSLAAARVVARQRLDEVGLARIATSPFRDLSGGEAQRLMLARGIATAPDLLLIDEPTAQLDALTAQSVNDAIATIARAHTIVVVATHDARTRDACTETIDLSMPRE